MFVEFTHKLVFIKSRGREKCRLIIVIFRIVFILGQLAI